MVTDFELLEMLSAKFCHDLSGPIGAVNNGVEFLREKESPDMEERAIQLIEISAKEAVTRLQFFRQTYGTVSPVGEANLDYLKTLTANYFEESKVQLDWSDGNVNAAPISISHKTGKLLLNVILICAGSLIYGGTLSIRFQKLPNGIRIKVSGTGNNVKVDPDAMKMLLGKGNENSITSRNVHPFFTCRLSKEIGATLALEHGADNMHLTIDKLRS